jgi:hypothetical protein
MPSRYMVIKKIWNTKELHDLSPIKIILDIDRQDGLKNFQKAHCHAFKKNELGNCHFVASALASDLCNANYTEGWIVTSGKIYSEKEKEFIEHSWLEYDGWVIDFSNNKTLILEREKYYDYSEAKELKHYPCKNFKDISIDEIMGRKRMR